MEFFLGAVVSLLVQWVKKSFTNEWQVLGILLVASLGAAAGYTALVATGYWQTVATILVTAGAFYAFVIQRFETKTPDA